MTLTSEQRFVNSSTHQSNQKDTETKGQGNEDELDPVGIDGLIRLGLGLRLSFIILQDGSVADYIFRNLLDLLETLPRVCSLRELDGLWAYCHAGQGAEGLKKLKLEHERNCSGEAGYYMREIRNNQAEAIRIVNDGASCKAGIVPIRNEKSMR